MSLPTKDIQSIKTRGHWPKPEHRGRCKSEEKVQVQRAGGCRYHPRASRAQQLGQEELSVPSGHQGHTGWPRAAQELLDPGDESMQREKQK